MKNNVLNFVIFFSLLRIQVCVAQNLSVEPSSKEALRIRELTEEFAESILAETKAIRFVYVDVSGEQNEYYFGLIVNRNRLVTNPPSYYFFNTKKEPIVVYTGFERNVKFASTYLNEIKELGENYLLGEEVIMAMHYYVWYVKFQNGLEVKLTKQLSNKRQRKIPAWITGR